MNLLKRDSSAWILTGFLFALTIAVYSRGLPGPLLLDDGPVIEPLLEHGRLAPEWRSQVWSATGPLGRPLAMLSFIANAAVNGGNYFWWKLTNLALHLATGLALWWFAAGLMAVASTGRPARPVQAALVVTGLWLLHPLQVSTVLYTVQRMTVLSALFAALGMACYVSGRRAMQDGQSGTGPILAAYGLCLPLAALSKESGLLLPCYLAVIEFVVLGGRGTLAQRRGLLVLHGVTLGLPALAVTAYYASHYESALLHTYAERGMSLGGRLLTEGRVVVHYLAQIAIPDRRQMGFFHDDFVASTGWFAPPATVWSALLLATLLGIAIAARRRLPLCAAGILLFFAGHLMESTIFPLEYMFEHRNYLPSFGILLALAGLVLALGEAYLRFTATTAVVATGLLALVTWTQASTWARLETLIPASYAIHPDSESASANLAEILSNSGRVDLALKIVGRLDTPGARLHQLYLLCKRDGRLASGALAPSILDSAPTLRPYAVTGIIEIANLGLDDKCVFDVPELRQLLASAVARPMSLQSQRDKLRIYQAHYAWKAGESGNALALLAEARRDAPTDPVPAMLATEWLLAMGEIARAEAMFSEAKRLVPRDRPDFQKMITDLEQSLREAAKR